MKQRRALKDLRESRGWSREEFAALLGLSVSTIYKWEAGTTEPRASTLRIIANEFGILMDDIDFPEVPTTQGRRPSK
jgi:transcriptional regulator with XRE-family HTH domain